MVEVLVIIGPLDMRTWISMGIEAASLPAARHGQSPATREFNMGVLQT